MKASNKTAKEINNNTAEEDEDEDADKDCTLDEAEEQEEEAEELEELEEERIVEDSEPPEEITNLKESFSRMTVVGKPTKAPFSMGFSFPCIMHQCVEGGRRRVSIDFLVIGMAKENHRLKIINNGTRLQLGMVIPSFFADENRLQIANEDDTGFNERSHKATAFEEVVNKVTANVDGEEPLLGSPQLVDLALPCQDEIDEWEMQAFNNEDFEWCDLFEAQQHFFLLSVNLVSTIKIAKKKKKGGFRALGSARREVKKDEEEEDDDDDQMEEGDGGDNGK